MRAAISASLMNMRTRSGVSASSGRIVLMTMSF